MSDDDVHNELQNPKFEFRNPKQIQNTNWEMSKTYYIFQLRILNFGHSRLFRISDFVLRI